MNPRASSLLITLPVLVLLATGCATTGPGAAARTSEVDDVYFSSSDRIAPRYAATATPAYDPTAPPAADGSVANPDYTGQPDNRQAGQQSNYYEGDAYTAVPRVTSPYYGSFNRYNSGYAYDPFWTGSSLAIGCGPMWGWGGPAFAYAPIYAGPRVRFGVSFGYGWGYSSWAAPMYGWAGPTFYDPFYDPFWGPSYYGYGYGWGYPAYGYGGWGGWGGGWRNGYRQGFYDGLYAGGGGIRNGRRVVYGPRLDRSAGAHAFSGGNTGRTTRSNGDRTVTPGAGGGNYQPASYGGYGGGSVSRATRASVGAPASSYQPAAAAPGSSPAPNYTSGATRISRGQISNAGQPAYQQQANDGRKRVQPMPAPAQEQRGNWLQRTTRSLNESSPARQSTPRTYSPPARMESGGGFRSGGGGSSGGGATRRSR